MMPTSFEIRDNYEKARHDVTYLRRLDEYDLNRVSDYTEDEWMSCVRHAANFMEMMDKKLYYPEEYRNGREVEYILERHMVNAQECQRVRDEIKRLRSLPTTIQQPAPAPSTPPPSGEQDKLSHSQIAILYHYKKQLINGNNADEIAQKYGQTSGQKLEETYKSLTSSLSRTAKGKYKVRDIEKVLPLLTEETKLMAEKELREAKKNNIK